MNATVNTLQHYTEIATKKPTHHLKYAIKDILDTLKNSDCLSQEYIEKLYAEFDAYTVEYHTRMMSTRRELFNDRLA